MKNYIVLLAFLFSMASCAQQNFTAETVALDDSLGIALIQIPKDVTLQENIAFELDGVAYSLKLDSEKRYQSTHKLTVGAKKYKAYITSLPLIQISAPNGIVNEPKRMSQISYAYSDTIFTSYAGIELRGSSSIAFPKKTYDINFYKDDKGKENRDVKLAGMRDDDDWILDGLYNEPLRMRSFLSLNLWNTIHSPYYLDKEPDAKAGATAVYAEVFVNNSYKGIFLLQEQVDRKLLQIKKIDGDTVRGEVFQGARYLGASSFDSIPVRKDYLASWGGYDIKYPTPTNQFWDNIYPFTKFVIESDATVFKNDIKDKFVIENAVDYFLFINAVRAPDNLGKNLFMVRYDQNEPYFYAPWDLDGSFGTIYNGRRIPTTDDFLTNGLLRRLIATDADNFVSKFKNRWRVLRADQLSNAALLEKQRNIYNFLQDELIFEREALLWEDFKYDEEGLDYMQEWTNKRLQFLDSYISKL